MRDLAPARGRGKDLEEHPQMVLSVVLLCAGGSAQAAETLRYTVIMEAGTIAGHQVVTRGDDGVTKVEFDFKNNGRGPQITEEYRLAPTARTRNTRRRARPLSAPRWTNLFAYGQRGALAQHFRLGTEQVEGTALYTALGGTPNGQSVALGALAKRPDGKLPLIPGGTLTMRKMGEAQVRHGADVRTVQLIMLTGVGLTPQFIWATGDPAPRLFAFIVPGYLRLIEEGWQDSGAALAAQQKQAEAAALVAFEQRLAHPLPGLTLIRNARVFDSEHATLGEPADVYVFRGRISAVLPAGIRREGADNVLDAGGRVLLPGLFDMHTHLSQWDGGLHVAAGVTSARDMANDNATLQQLITAGGRAR